MLWCECFFCLHACREWQSAQTHAHMVLKGSLDSPPFAPWCHSFPLLCEFSLPSRTLEDPKNLFFMYTSYLGCNRLRGEPGLLSQQRTTHHFLLSSLLLGLITGSKHSGSMILLVSQGRLFIQFFSQHYTVARSFSVEGKRWEIGDSAKA